MLVKGHQGLWIKPSAAALQSCEGAGWPSSGVERSSFGPTGHCRNSSIVSVPALSLQNAIFPTKENKAQQQSGASSRAVVEQGSPGHGLCRHRMLTCMPGCWGAVPLRGRAPCSSPETPDFPVASPLSSNPLEQTSGHLLCSMPKLRGGAAVSAFGWIYWNEFSWPKAWVHGSLLFSFLSAPVWNSLWAASSVLTSLHLHFPPGPSIPAGWEPCFCSLCPYWAAWGALYTRIPCVMYRFLRCQYRFY